MSTISLIIDSVKVEATEGTTVLEAAQGAGIHIPTLCTGLGLEPYGGCRLCLVEIEGVEGLPSSCTMPVTEGMVVHTISNRISEVRRRTVELLLSDHPDNCLLCPMNQHCELQKVAAYVGVNQQRFKRLERPNIVDSSNPFFVFDSNRCILCGKCVRICEEIQGVGALEVFYEGVSSKIVAADGAKSLLESTCESCGQCVANCPTGALAAKDFQWAPKEVKTTCPYCGTGCGMHLAVSQNKVVRVRGDVENPVNKGKLCVKGQFGLEFINHPDRLVAPLIKQNGALSESTWDEALELVANKLSKYRGDEIAVISSAKCTNEENYLIQKFTRAVLNTNNIDHCARLCHMPTANALTIAFGNGAMTNSIKEISRASCILAIGTNTTATHPVIGIEIKKAVRDGAKLIVVNPREVDLCRIGQLWIRNRPGSDVALLMGMMRVIVDEGLADTFFIEERCENFEVFKKSLESFDLGFVERITGVPGEEVAKAARLYATSKPATILYNMGITQHTHGVDNVLALTNLAMLTGNVGKPSTGVNPLRGQNNVQGACDMGALPPVYTGYQRVEDPAIRGKFMADWECSLPSEPGLTLTEIFQAAYDGKIKAIYLIGENPVLSEPDAKHAEEALKRLDLFVVQDLFLSETAKLAHVVLPATSFAEKDGTFTNTERRIQRVHKALEPIGNSKPDWLITCQIAQKMGAKGFAFSDPSEIMEEIARLTPSYGGVTYDRLEDGGLQWPCPTEAHPGTQILHEDTFSRGRGKFMPLEYKPPAELPDDKYPLILTTERNLYHFHTGTLSRKVKGLNVLKNEELVEMNPMDAEALEINDGDRVKVLSRRGELVTKVRITAVSPPGVVCMSFHFAECPTNRLTNPAVDPIAKTPELKVCAVRVEKELARVGGNQ